MLNLDDILRFSVEHKASDIHLTAGSAPVFRLNGNLYSADEGWMAGLNLPWKKVLTPKDTAELAEQVLNQEQKEKFKDSGDLDLSYSIPKVGRFRVNVFRQRGGVGLALRVVPFRIPSFQELGLPEVLASLARRPHGLVLVTGPTGSGKSTTLAAMIDLINSGRSCHIITLEDPIEYLHQHKKSIVNQREIGIDSLSFAKALRAAMRQDPDVILVGEMRDLETIAIAITAAETGHLVFATLHTNDTTQTVDRIIDVFPPNQQQQIRIQLATTLQGIVAQQLLPRFDGKGRVVAQEILVATPAIRNLIRDGKTHQLLSAIQTGGKFGMQTMDAALRHLVQTRVVALEEAVKRASDPDAFQRFLLSH